jgi:hypothetical protein
MFESMLFPQALILFAAGPKIKGESPEKMAILISCCSKSQQPCQGTEVTPYENYSDDAELGK